MVGLVVFIFLSIGSILFILWTRVAERHNIEDMCDTCKHRDCLEPSKYENSVCCSCTLANPNYEEEVYFKEK